MSAVRIVASPNRTLVHSSQRGRAFTATTAVPFAKRLPRDPPRSRGASLPRSCWHAGMEADDGNVRVQVPPVRCGQRDAGGRFLKPYFTGKPQVLKEPVGGITGGSPQSRADREICPPTHPRFVRQPRQIRQIRTFLFLFFGGRGGQGKGDEERRRRATFPLSIRDAELRDVSPASESFEQ